MQWTNDQQQVIDTGTRNILVSAAAGSGKTAVLVQRVIERLMDSDHPVDIDRFLIVTFTNAAAAQMKDRIGRRLRDQIEKLKDVADRTAAQNKALYHLEKQLHLLPLSHISTLHSFCTGVLKEHFQELDIDPGFRAGEEGELTLLKKKAMEETLEEYYTRLREQPESTEAILLQSFVDHYSPGKSDMAIEELIGELADIALQDPFPYRYLETLVQMYESEQGAAGIARYLWIEVKNSLRGIAQAIDLRLAFWKEKAEILPDGIKIDKFIETLCCDRERFAALEAIVDQDEWLAAFYQLDFVRLGSITGPKSDAKLTALWKGYGEYDKQYRAEYKALYEKARRLHPISEQEAIYEFALLGPHVRILTDLTRTYLDKYKMYKKAKGLIDFDDMEHLTLEVLVRFNEDDGSAEPTAAALTYREFFEEIMVDEYQDSNQIQETILNSLTESDGNRMMVGDVKQSIYRFRQARPELFREKMKDYPKINGTIPPDEMREVTILLNKNFRSRPEVLDSANAVFSRLMREDIGGINYDHSQVLHSGASFPPGSQTDHRTEVFIVDTSDSDTFSDKQSGDEAQAQWIAEEILRLQTQGWVYDEDLQAYRRPQNRDFAILLRSPSNRTDTYVRVLSANDLYVMTEKRTGYFAALEIQNMLAYLYSLHNPQRDIDFVTVLTSPMVKIEDNELARIRIYALQNELGNDDFASACRRFAQDHSDETAVKLTAFFAVFDELRQLVRHVPVSELLVEVMEKTGYRLHLSRERQAERKLGNIRILIEKAKAFDGSGNMGLFAFLHFIKQLKKYKEDFAEAVEAAEEQAIVLMSIHKSKGLEYPFVFVSDLGSSFRNEGQGEAIVYHHDLKIGLDIVDRERRSKRASALKNLINYQNTAETRGEEQRILYVAMTRAKEKLYLIGSTGKWEEREQRWKQEAQRLDFDLQLPQEPNTQPLQEPNIQSLHEPLQEANAELSQGSADLPTALSANFRLGINSRLDWLMPVVFSREGQRHFSLTVKPIDSILQAESRPIERSEAVETAAVVEAAESIEAAAELGGAETAEASEPTEVVSVVYPYAADTRIPAKVSVSYLKHLQMEEGTEEPALMFDIKRYWENEHRAMETEQKLRSGPLYGTAFHRLMECLEYQELARIADRSVYLTELTAKLAVDEQWDARLDLTALQKEAEAFLDSEIGAAMSRAALADALYREHDFIIGVPARELESSWDSDEYVLVQGVIDACYLDENGYHIVDYKTDRVRAMKELRDLYQVQLQLYARAWQQLTGKAVTDCRIYSTVFRESLTIDWVTQID